MIEKILTPQLIDALGWTLLHSLWQAAAFAILLVLMLIAMKRYSAQARYIISVSMLSAFFITVAITFVNQWTLATELHQVSVSEGVTTIEPQISEAFAKADSPTTGHSISASDNTYESWIETFRSYYQDHLPLLVTMWLLGVLFLQLRFLGQLAYVQRLRHYGTELIPSSWNERIEELEDKLRIQKKVRYLTSIRIGSPMVVGWLKPVILFPKDLFHSLSDSEIYTVLAHELAHIRREDFVVNFVQSFLCNIFFFHPGVWWMSNRIDEEREHCCDDLAMTTTGTAITYARTLINISQYNLSTQTGAQQLAVAFAGKRKKKSGFTSRIKRLFVTNNGGDAFREGFTSALILIAALTVGVMAIGQTDNVESNTVIESISHDVQLEEDIAEDLIIDNGLNSDRLPVERPSEPARAVKPTIAVESPQSATNDYAHDARLDALIKACNKGKIEIVRSLVEGGIDINKIGTEGFTPLMSAVNNDHSRIVAYLIDQGAKVNEFSNGWSALIEAADEGAIKSMKLLLDAGADVNYYRSPMSPTAASMAASEGHIECLKTLDQYGADLNGNGSSAPPLHMAAEEGKLYIVKYLLGKKVDVNKKNALGQTALMYAASEGKLEVAEVLITAGADMTLKDRKGQSAIDYVEDQEMLNFLKTYRSYDKMWSGNQTLPDIHQATLDGKIEYVADLVAKGVDVDSRDALGRTSLHIASAQNHNIDMQVLLDLGANINAKDNLGRTPIM